LDTTVKFCGKSLVCQLFHLFGNDTDPDEHALVADPRSGTRSGKMMRIRSDQDPQHCWWQMGISNNILFIARLPLVSPWSLLISGTVWPLVNLPLVITTIVVNLPPALLTPGAHPELRSSQIFEKKLKKALLELTGAQER
jgi:hypothetical protein